MSYLDDYDLGGVLKRKTVETRLSATVGTSLSVGTSLAVGDCAQLLFTNGAWHMIGGTATLA